MEKILLKTCAVKTVSSDVNLISRASASMMVSRLWSTDWHSSRVLMKHSNNFPFCAKKTFSKAFWCDRHLVVDTLCGRWICWILDSFCFSSRMSLRFLNCEKKACNFSNAPNKDFAAKEDPQASIITRFSTWSNVEMNMHCRLTCWTRVFTPLYFPVMTDAPS